VKFHQSVAALPSPDREKDAFYWDDALPGFGVRLHREPHGGTRRVALGDPAVVSLDEARDTARNLLARVRLGGDPQA